MLLFESTTNIGDTPTGAETTVTIDFDKVSAIINGGTGLTGLMFDGGFQLTIQSDYVDVLKFLSDNSDDEAGEEPGHADDDSKTRR